MAETLGSRREVLPAGSDMAVEVNTPDEGHQPTGARAPIAVGSVVSFHGRIEEPHINDTAPLHHLHGEVKPLPKDQ